MLACRHNFFLLVQRTFSSEFGAGSGRQDDAKKKLSMGSPPATARTTSAANAVRAGAGAAAPDWVSFDTHKPAVHALRQAISPPTNSPASPRKRVAPASASTSAPSSSPAASPPVSNSMLAAATAAAAAPAAKVADPHDHDHLRVRIDITLLVISDCVCSSNTT